MEYLIWGVLMLGFALAGNLAAHSQKRARKYRNSRTEPSGGD